MYEYVCLNKDLYDEMKKALECSAVGKSDVMDYSAELIKAFLEDLGN